MDAGTFVGKQEADKTLEAMAKKFKLDDLSVARLADKFGAFEGTKKKEMYDQLERHLEVSNKPSAMAMMLLRKLTAGESLGQPGRPAPGSFADKQAQEARDRRSGGDKDKDSKGDRDRD